VARTTTPAAENRSSFRLGEISLAATSIYSLDRSLFRFIAPEAASGRSSPPNDRQSRLTIGAPTWPNRRQAVTHRTTSWCGSASTTESGSMTDETIASEASAGRPTALLP
jgi:hypothetical protein